MERYWLKSYPEGVPHDVAPEQYRSLPKPAQADAIWRALFIESSPVSEATRGIVAVLNAFGLPTDNSGLTEARAFFKHQRIEDHIPKVVAMAGISSVVMTNDPLDSEEQPVWMKGVPRNTQFQPVLRLDRLLREWSDPWPLLASQGYAVDDQASGESITEIRRFLADWCERIKPVYTVRCGRRMADGSPW